ncbi:RNA-guided endonuclease InsQ/TnpB family protein [Streptomyces tendae]|uniref:RNA-guided endonuclease InsQ/TnpB family protein n=1 Tax=Streptomyces tendae TaxID=1932 RepID=UPI003659CA66
MQLRYSFRLYPNAVQQAALARAFGCARVVFNDAVRARENARAAGEPFPKIGELSTRLITQAKTTPERSWLGEVSAVVLQQSLRDAETAYRNFFASLGSTRKGPRLGAPRFKSRKDHRQSIRFTANARWKITDVGRLDLPKIGAVTCSACGTLHDRDTNAAINVKTAAGLAASACGAPVRPGAIPAQREETGSHGFPTGNRAA